MPLKTKVKGKQVITDITQLDESIDDILDDTILRPIITHINESSPELSSTQKTGYIKAIQKRRLNYPYILEDKYIVLYTTTSPDGYNCYLHTDLLYYHILVWDSKDYCDYGASSYKSTLFRVFYNGIRVKEVEEQIVKKRMRGKQNATKK